jgi:hypothetical protein
MDHKSEYTSTNLLHLITEIDGVTLSSYPTVCCNWDTMEVFPKNYISDDEIADGKSIQFVKGVKYRSEDDMIEFVKKNKHQIIVYEAYIMGPDFYSALAKQNFSPIPGPILRHVRKPNSTML